MAPATGPAHHHSHLKDLITQAREHGYLTYADVNDHLPADISDPDQIEEIIQTLNDLGIQVFEEAPDSDTLLLTTGDTSTDTTTEEAVAVLTAVEAEHGRTTTDPVRLYMREMGASELLTREGEIRVAQRIEDGIRETMAAVAHLPGTDSMNCASITRPPYVQSGVTGARTTRHGRNSRRRRSCSSSSS